MILSEDNGITMMSSKKAKTSVGINFMPQTMLLSSRIRIYFDVRSQKILL